MKLFKKILIYAVIFWISVFSVYGQNTLKELKKKQENLNRDIAETTKAIKNTKKKRIKTINQLYLMNQQIKKREELIHEYVNEITLIDGRIMRNKTMIDSILEKTNQLKSEYAEIIRRYYLIYKNKGNLLAYILSSKNVNQAYRRMKYYQQYLDYSHKIFQNLKEALEKIKIENNHLKKNKIMQVQAIRELKREEEKYKSEKAKKNRYVVLLRKKERTLRKNLKDKERIQNQLSRAMKNMIAEEKKKNRGMALTPEESIIAGKFDANRGKLPWPTKKGIIIEEYGSHRHPILKNMIIKNDGVDIMTETGSYARTVFEGEVRKIIAIPGANETVIIKHGNYYTVYQNVFKVNVKVGQRVIGKEKIGIIFTNPDNNETILHFEIWKGTSKMNPESWLAKSK